MAPRLHPDVYAGRLQDVLFQQNPGLRRVLVGQVRRTIRGSMSGSPELDPSIRARMVALLELDDDFSSILNPNPDLGGRGGSGLTAIPLEGTALDRRIDSVVAAVVDFLDQPMGEFKSERSLSDVLKTTPATPWSDAFLRLIELDSNEKAQNCLVVNPAQATSILGVRFDPDKAARANFSAYHAFRYNGQYYAFCTYRDQHGQLLTASTTPLTACLPHQYHATKAYRFLAYAIGANVETLAPGSPVSFTLPDNLFDQINTMITVDRAFDRTIPNVVNPQESVKIKFLNSSNQFCWVRVHFNDDMGSVNIVGITAE